MKGKTNRSYHFLWVFSPHAKVTWNLSVKIGEQLVNYANISVIMELFPHVCNIEFVPKSIIMQGKYYRISGKKTILKHFDMCVKIIYIKET